MSFLSDGSKIAAEINKIDIYGQKGIGVYQIIFQVNFMLKAWDDFETVFRNLNAEIFITEKGQRNKDYFLGIAFPVTPFIEKAPNKRDRQSYAKLKMLLSPHQVEMIEDFRKGEDLNFRLNLSCELSTRFSDDRQDINISQTERFDRPVNKSEWINILENIGYGKYFLLEVPIPDGIESKIPNNIHSELKSAQSHFMKGHYDVTVSKCRKVLELLTKLLSDSSSLDKTMNLFLDKALRPEMNKEERFYMIRKAIVHYAHLAHHSEKDGNITQFNRIEAQQILSMTISTLSYFISEYTK